MLDCGCLNTGDARSASESTHFRARLTAYRISLKRSRSRTGNIVHALKDVTG